MIPLDPTQRALAEAGKPVVDRLAKKVSNLMLYSNTQELQSIGYIALTKCALRYRPDFGVPFTGYFICRVRHAMTDHIVNERKKEKLSLTAITHASVVGFNDEPAPALPNSDPNAPTSDRDNLAQEIRQKVGMLATAAVLSNRYTALPRHQPQPIEDQEEEKEVLRAREHATRELTTAKDELAPELRQVIDLLHFEEKTLEETAEQVGVSKRHVQRLHNKAIEALAKKLRWQGIEEAPI